MVVFGAIVSHEESKRSSFCAVSARNCLGTVVLFVRSIVVETFAAITRARRRVRFVKEVNHVHPMEYALRTPMLIAVAPPTVFLAALRAIGLFMAHLSTMPTCVATAVGIVMKARVFNGAVGADGKLGNIRAGTLQV